jgi:hypothetical protein
MRRIDLIALVAAMALLALGPLALTLARTDHYHSTAVISLNPDNPVGRYLPNLHLLRGPLSVKDVQKGIARQVGWFAVPTDLPDYVKVSELDPRSFVVTARGPGGEQAQELAGSSAQRARDAAETAGGLVQGALLQATTRMLRRSGLPGSRRASLETRRRVLAASLRDQRSIYSPSTAATLPPEKIGDRVLGALPGERTFRPNPVWAGVAGFALAGALGLWAFALGGVRPRRRASTGG